MSLPYFDFGYKGKLGELPLNQGVNIPFQYFVEIAPIGEVLTLDQVKKYLKIDFDDDDNLLQLLILSVVEFAQTYTRLTFLTTTYITFRDFFNYNFLLKKSPFQEVNVIEYKKDDIFTEVDPSVYYTTRDNIYSNVVRKSGKSWPSDVDSELQSIKILFKAGFGDTAADIPSVFIEAMLQHIAKMYEDRGDCDNCDCDLALPSQARMIYDMYRIRDMGTTTQIG